MVKCGLPLNSVGVTVSFQNTSSRNGALPCFEDLLKTRLEILGIKHSGVHSSSLSKQWDGLR